MNTTRKYPRTLNEAFPKSAAYACAVEAPMHTHDKIVVIASILAFFALVVMWMI